jgi:hypothetical protein
MIRFALGVLVGYAWATGRLGQLLTPERVEQLRGQLGELLRIVGELVAAAGS